MPLKKLPPFSEELRLKRRQWRVESMADLVAGQDDPEGYLRRWLAKFWSKVDVKNKDQCWTWNGCRSDNEYGKIFCDRVIYYAHRISFLIHNGKIDPELVVMHSCDNRRCVNPYHLSNSTQFENTMDAAIKGRYIRKLNKHKVQKIRALRESGLSLVKIANQFGVCHTAINKVVKRKTWAYVK